MASDIEGWISRMLSDEGADAVDFLQYQQDWVDFASSYLTAFSPEGQQNQFQALLDARYNVLSDAVKEWGFTLSPQPNNPSAFSFRDMSSGQFISADTAKEMASAFMGL